MSLLDLDLKGSQKGGKHAKVENLHRQSLIYICLTCRMLMRSHDRPEATYRCPTLSTDSRNRNWNDHSLPNSKVRIDPKVLLFVETTFSKVGRDIAELLVYNRMK